MCDITRKNCVRSNQLIGILPRLLLTDTVYSFLKHVYYETVIIIFCINLKKKLKKLNLFIKKVIFYSNLFLFFISTCYLIISFFSKHLLLNFRICLEIENIVNMFFFFLHFYTFYEQTIIYLYLKKRQHFFLSLNIYTTIINLLMPNVSKFF